jgi:hypothetical protein
MTTTAPQSGGCVLPTGQPHRYTSTACLHGEHDYCSGTTRQDGSSKTPAQCKFCSAPCECPHHADSPAGPLSEPVAGERAEDGEQGTAAPGDATGAEISSWVSPVHTTGTGSDAEGWERLRATTRLIAESEDRAAERARTGRLVTTNHVRQPSRDTAYIGPDADEDEPSAEDVEAILGAARMCLSGARTDAERAEVVEALLESWYDAWPDTAITSPHEAIAGELVRMLRPDVAYPRSAVDATATGTRTLEPGGWHTVTFDQPIPFKAGEDIVEVLRRHGVSIGEASAHWLRARFAALTTEEGE